MLHHRPSSILEKAVAQIGPCLEQAGAWRVDVPSSSDVVRHVIGKTVDPWSLILSGRLRKLSDDSIGASLERISWPEVQACLL